MVCGIVRKLDGSHQLVVGENLERGFPGVGVCHRVGVGVLGWIVRTASKHATEVDDLRVHVVHVLPVEALAETSVERRLWHFEESQIVLELTFSCAVDGSQMFHCCARSHR